MLGRLRGKPPKLYGSVTVAERGQVVIPAEARRDLKMGPSTKLLVFSGPDKRGLMFVKAEAVTEFISHATAMLSKFEQVIGSNTTETTKRKP
jgi:AbrB family looped-hinge helix DNA binding protein